MIAHSPRTRLIIITAAAAILLAGQPLIQLASAQDATQVENAKVNFAGTINANNVYIRSGPGENYYATLKLDKGAAVTVIGLKFDWLKILPPDGSFSYVARAYVEKFGDGSRGRVTKSDLNVRAGSDLNAMKTTVQTKLQQNDEVQIIGEQEEYFKIKPPQGAYLYINKQFADPNQQMAATPAPVDVKNSTPIASAPMVTNPVAPAPVSGTVVTQTPDAPVAGTSTTQPSAAVAAVPTTQGTGSQVAALPATQPAVASAETRFDELESAFLDATNQPIDQQPLDNLLKHYTQLSKEDTLPVSMRRIAELRINTLKLRTDARDQYLSARKMEEEAKARQMALKAEQDELQQRSKDLEVTTYTAVGTLRPSSLQMTGGILYRLTDPNTGRTLLYVRTDDSKYAAFLGHLIGVRGELSENTQVNLKILTPTAAEAVDAAKVGNAVTAQILPPTLLPRAATASISN